VDVEHCFPFVAELRNSGLEVDLEMGVEVVSAVLDEEVKGGLEFRELELQGL
jgi:hypothetical protein